MPDLFDAVVVGSGAAGGMAASELCLKGLKVLLLEAGPKLDQATDFHHHQQPYEFPFRGRVRPRERAKYNYVVNEWNRPSFVNELDHPYTGKKFVWVRARAVGGKTLHWGLVALRFSPRDFQAATYDGYGDNWPITYDDVEPYYTRAEKMIGVCGNPDHLENNPDSHFLKPVPLTCPEAVFRSAMREKFSDRPVIYGRSATATEPINGRAPCHYCGHCGRVCNVSASFSSAGVLLPIAEKTGNLTLRTNAVAWKVLTDKNGKAKSVLYVDRLTRQPEEALGKVIVVGAGCLESTRMLPGFGAKFKEDVKKNHAAVFSIGSFGEVLARPENYVEIDPEVRDAWGIPVLKFNIEWGPNELAMAKDMVETQREMFEAAGIEVMSERAQPLPPGWSIHEEGTARMGNDPKKSFVTKFNQSHEIKNLFVVDGAAFVSATEKNPTLTLLTLSMRAADYIAEEMRRGAFG